MQDAKTMKTTVLLDPHFFEPVLTNQSPSIRIENLVKIYGNASDESAVRAVSGVSLDL